MSKIAKIRQIASLKSRHCPQNDWTAKLYEDDIGYIFATEFIRDNAFTETSTIKKGSLEAEPEVFHQTVLKLAGELCEKYQLISTNEDVFKGKPHLKGTRFTVADVLSAICIYNGIDEAMDAYQNRYSEEQLKEAIRFARDFLLSAHSVK